MTEKTDTGFVIVTAARKKYPADVSGTLANMKHAAESKKNILTGSSSCVFSLFLNITASTYLH